MNPRYTIILANGDLTDPPRMRQRLENLHLDRVIAADGGARHAETLGLSLDIVIGDMDSIDAAELERLTAHGVQIVTRSADKDETDLELALLHAVSQGDGSILVLGGTGDRMDMTLSNIFLLLHPALRRRRVQLWQGLDTAFAVFPPGGEIHGSIGDTVSLIPLGRDAAGIVTSGLAFPLRGESLPLGLARGVSNVLTASPASVEFSEGALLIVHRAGSDLRGKEGT